MKILFSADWHIKLRQKNVPTDWQEHRYRMLFEKLHKLEDDVDIHIIGGDIFDKSPTIKELALFFDFIKDCKIPTLMYDGNHEATKRGHTFLESIYSTITGLNPMCEGISGVKNVLGIDFIPYTDLKTFKPSDRTSNILCTHVRGNIPPHVKEEIPLDKFKDWDVVLAGDLHSHSNTQENIIYPGSPLSTAFHRAKTEKGVVIFDTTTLGYEFIDLDLPQLLRITVDNPEDAKGDDYHLVVYELQGNIDEIGSLDIKDTNISKKVVKTNSGTQLELEGMSILEELKEYLQKVQLLSEDSISDVVSAFIFHERGL